MAAGPGAGENPQLAEQQDAWAQSPRDADVYNALNPSTQARFAEAYAQNPSQVKNNPWVFTGLAQQSHVPTNAIPSVVKYLTAYNQFGGLAKYQGQQNPAKASTSFWGAIGNGIRGAWDSAASYIHKHGFLGTGENMVKDVAGGAWNVANKWAQGNAERYTGPNGSFDLSKGLKSDVQADVNVGKGIGAAGKGLALATADIVKRAAVTQQEINSLGRWNPKTGKYSGETGWGSLTDAANTINNIVQEVGNPVSKNSLWFGKNNIFNMMSHNMAFYESMASRYGWAYTIGYMTPQMALGVATDGAFTAADTGAELTTEEIVTENYERAVAEKTLTPELEQAYKTVMERKALQEEMAAGAEKKLAEEEEGAPAEEEPTPQEGPTNKKITARGAAAKTFEYATKPLKSIFEVARAAGKPMASLKMNVMYASTAMAAQADPELRALWEKTRNGVVYDAAGKAVGTDGQMLATYFGIDKGNMFFSPVSGLTDFYTKWLGTDPLGAWGEAVGKARTFEGFSGMMGKWFGGLGVRGADDVTRTYEQYGRVRNAVRYMANHSASEIIDTFRNTFTDGVRNLSDTRSIINQLGEAQTEEEVIHILSDVAEGYGFTGHMMPTLSLYEVGKAGLRGSIRTFAHSVENYLEADTEFVKKWSKIVREQTGFDTRPNSMLEYSDAAGHGFRRQFVTFSRWMSTRFTREAAYADELTGAVENKIIRPGSIAAIPAIMDYMRASLMPENVVRTVGDALLKASTREEYFNVYRNAMFHSVMRRATAGLDHAEFEVFIERGEDWVWNEVVRMTSLDGGGDRGVYIAGPEGFNLSKTYQEDFELGKFAGIGMNHLGNMRFARTSELKGLATTVRKFAEELRGEHAGEQWLRVLGNEERIFREFADFNEANFEEAAKAIEEGFHKTPEMYTNVLGEEAGADALAGRLREASVKGYEDANQEFLDRLKELKGDKNMPGGAKYARFAKHVQEQTHSLLNLKSQLEELSLRAKSEEYTELLYTESYKSEFDKAMTAYPDLNLTNVEEKLAEVKGRLIALQEVTPHITAAFSRNPGSEAAAEKALYSYAQLEKKAKTVSEELDRRLKEKAQEFLSGRKSGYIRGPQVGIDAINRLLSRTFVPIALTSGGWAIRVSASEGILNTLRQGFWPTFDSTVARSLAKHELAGEEYKVVPAVRSTIEKEMDRTVAKVEKAAEEYQKELGIPVGRLTPEDIEAAGYEKNKAAKQAEEVANFVKEIGASKFRDAKVIFKDEINDKAAAEYEKGLVSIYKDGLNNPGKTLIHELWHHLEQYLRPETKELLTNEMNAARTELESSKVFKQWLEEKQLESFNWDRPALDMAVELSDFRYYARDKGIFIKQGNLYRLTNVQEWFAVEGEKAIYLREKEQHPNSLFEWVRKFFRSMFKSHAAVNGNAETQKVIKQFLARQYEEQGIDVSTKLMERHEADAAFEKGMSGTETARERAIHEAINDPSKSSEAKLIRNVVAKALHRIANPQIYKDIAGGAMMGIQRNILASMDDAERQRMIDHFVGTITRYDGHLPGAVHSSTGVFSDSSIDHGSARMTQGIGADGTIKMTEGYQTDKFVHGDPFAPNYITGLLENLHRTITDDILAPSGQLLRDVLYNAGYSRVLTKYGAGGEFEREFAKLSNIDVLNLGAARFTKDADIQKLQKDMEKIAYNKIMSLDEDTRNAFERSAARIKPEVDGGRLARDTAEEEWAAVVAYHVMHSVSGEGKFGRTIHGVLVDSFATGSLPDEADLASEVRRWRKRGNAPSHIPMHEFTETDPMRDGAIPDMLRRINEVAHEKVLGPIVNRLSREHVFLLEQHLEMEKFEPLIEKGIVTRETAEMMADKNALVKMTKFVHNPKEKTLFEQNMRMFAPFYFAQNQAWRRALRVLQENPGAFEKYMKLCLGITGYVSNATSNQGLPSINIPGITAPGYFGSRIADMPFIGGMAEGGFQSLSMGLAADPGSVSSVVPTGAESGLSGAFGLLRPSWGPLVTIAVKGANSLLGISHHDAGRKWINAMLGPISSNSSVWSDIFPSGAGRDFIDIGLSLYGAIPGSKGSGLYLESAENNAINNAMDNIMNSRIDEVMNTTDFSGLNTWTGRPWTKDEISAYARSQAETWVAQKMQNPEYRQEFIDRAKAAAIMMTAVQAIVSFASPVAVTLQNEFSKMPEFEKILASVNPTTGKKYTFEDAALEYSNQYPGNIFDLTAHSISPYSEYPETVSAINMLQKYGNVVEKYPYSSAYLINRNTAYAPPAYQLELSMGLRQQETPPDYLNALLTAAGNDYFYNFLSVDPQFGGTGDAAAANTTYAQYEALQAAAKYYGRNDNPVWYDNFVGQQKQANEVRALNQMRSFLNDKEVPSGMLSGQDRANLNYLMAQYDATISEVNLLKQSGQSSIASLVENSWYTEITNAANEPQWANQAYFMTSVLRGLPTKN